MISLDMIAIRGMSLDTEWDASGYIYIYVVKLYIYIYMQQSDIWVYLKMEIYLPIHRFIGKTMIKQRPVCPILGPWGMVQRNTFLGTAWMTPNALECLWSWCYRRRRLRYR